MKIPIETEQPSKGIRKEFVHRQLNLQVLLWKNIHGKNENLIRRLCMRYIYTQLRVMSLIKYFIY